MNVTRAYAMSARADAAEATGHRILDAFIELVAARPIGEFSLDDVAERAGVSTRTVIRRFGGKSGLLREAIEFKMGDAAGSAAVERARAPVGDLVGTVAVLDEHYDKWSPLILGFLAEEHRRPEIAEILESGRRMHSEWCERTFAAAMDGLAGPARRERLAQLVAVCDIYTWKVLRHDRGLSSSETRAALVGILRPLTEAF